MALALCDALALRLCYRTFGATPLAATVCTISCVFARSLA